MSYSVLALDLATTVGWAHYHQGMVRPFWGNEKLPGKPHEIGKPAERLRQIIVDQHRMHTLTDIVFEAQHVAAKMNPDTIYRLFCLGGMVEWLAFRLGVRCYKVSISEWRKHFLGRGSSFGDADPKELCIQRCADIGWIVRQSDEADACGILDYYLHMLNQADPRFVIPWRDRLLLGTDRG